MLITASSPEDYLNRQEKHPMSMSMRPLLERAGLSDSVRAEALAVLRAGNEQPDAFGVQSPYRVIELQPEDSATS